MPHISLTQLGAERLRAVEREVLYWDKNMPGFGLRVSPKGRKTFLVQYRFRQPDGALKERQETLGTLDFLTVVQARDRARQSKAKASSGIDPVAERQAASKAEKEERQANEFTFAKLVERYQREYVDLNTKASSAELTERLLKRWTDGPKAGMRGLGDRPIREIRKADILNFLNDLLAGKSNGKGRTEANNLLGVAQRLLEWARKHDLIETNPAKDIAKPMPRMTTRDRWLTD